MFWCVTYQSSNQTTHLCNFTFFEDIQIIRSDCTVVYVDSFGHLCRFSYFNLHYSYVISPLKHAFHISNFTVLFAF